MKLEMGYIRVSDVRLGTESVFRDGVLTLDGEAVRSMIIEKIKKCLYDYELEIIKFKPYRDFIKNEKDKFSFDVKRIFSY